MEKKLKEKWINALRSGEYKQGRGSLVKRWKDGDLRHCCLGVLCAINSKKTMTEDSRTWDTSAYDKAGLDQDDIIFLIDKNDVERCKFSTIANWIEKNL